MATEPVVKLDRTMSIIMLVVVTAGGVPLLVGMAATAGLAGFLLGLILVGAAEAGMALTLSDTYRSVKED